MTMSSAAQACEDSITEYVTAMIGGQLFGLPISRVQDVFIPERMTRVPLASSDVAGVLNLRGRIVTAIDMRSRLGLPKSDHGRPPMAVGVDLRGESYGLLIDSVGEVLKLADDSREVNPGQSRSADGEDGARDSPAGRAVDGGARRRSRARDRA